MMSAAPVMRAAVCLGLACFLAGSAGCASDPTKGYSFSSTFDDEIRTVAVPVFGNETFNPGLETTLTDAIIKRIQSRTPWKVTSEDRAETRLRGQITDSGLSTLSEVRETGLVEEQAVRLTVDFSWVDRRTGDVLASAQSLSAAATFVPARGEAGEPGERIQLGERGAIEELAAAIVDRMRSTW